MQGKEITDIKSISLAQKLITLFHSNSPPPSRDFIIKTRGGGVRLSLENLNELIDFMKKQGGGVRRGGS